jgi:integrase/recombinase XerD
MTSTERHLPTGYKPTSIDTLLRSLAGWTDWMLAAGLTAKELVPGLDARKLEIEEPCVRYRRGPNHHSVTAASVFIRFL